MDSPILDILSFVLGYLFSYYLTNYFRIFTKKYNISLARVIAPFPPTLGGLIAIPLVLVTAVFVICNFVWGKLAFDCIIENDIKGFFEVFFINLFSCFYVAFITKNMDK